MDVELPDDYLFFLKNVGYVFWFSVSFYGIAEHKYDSVVFRTKYIRDADLPADFLSIPEPTIVFTDYGGGGFYFLYCKGSSRCGQVVELLDECMYRESKSWPDIWSFIEDRYL